MDGVEKMFEELYDAEAPPLKLWLNAPALMGEREEHDTLERAARYNAIARRMLIFPFFAYTCALEWFERCCM